MKKENRILYRIAVLFLACLALAAWAADFDSDGMDDSYESFFGLSTNNAADALLDPDGDSLTNLQESVLWTDPFIPDTDKDGWNDNIDSNPLSRAVFLWGDAQFTSNDVYRYTFPAWCSNGFKLGGIWATNGWTADSSLSSNTGSLNIQVLRELLTNNAILDVELFDATNSSLFVALCDTNQDVIVSNLYGQSIVTGSQVTVTRRLSIPFSSYSNASIVRLWRGTGNITVSGSLMYIDEDGDGLDADQELQAGTSDSDTDSDDDGLNDFAELMLTHTDPLDTDTDNDGYSDYIEVMAESDPNNSQSLPVSAVSVFGTVIYSGSETGTIYVAAVTVSNDWNLAKHDELAAPGAYSITNVPVLSNVWVKAWRDANGNGVRDPWEAQGAYMWNPLYLTLPASNINVTLTDYRQDYSLPFAETFEAVAGMAGTPGSVDGQHGWSVSGAGYATVQSNTVFGGSQALEIADATASHDFIDGQTNVWVSYRVKAVRGSAPQNIPTNMAVVFYVNSAGNLCVYSNQTAVALPVSVPDGWNRFDFHCDYAAKLWDMRFNREQVVSSYPFYGSPDAFSILRLDGKGTGTYMDDVQVVYANPDRDDDGYTNDEETQAGSDPDDAQSLPGVAVSGTVTYSGSQTGTVHIVAVTVSNDWNLTTGVSLAGAGAYSITNAPVMTNIWIKAWRDTDGDGLCDLWEAQGVYGTNPLYLLDPVSGINLTLSDPDGDSDSLPDWWEYAHFSGLSSGSTDDPDGDGLVNSNELARLTNPNDADTDDDNWSDSEEVTLGSDPLNDLSIPVTHVTVSGTVGYTGLQTGTVRVLAVTDAESWSTVCSVSAAQPGAYSITNVPVLSNVWIKAWRDSDGNGSNGLYEASAVYSNMLYLTRSVSNIVLTLTDADSDSDSLPDWWEMNFFTNLSQGATNDADGDTLSNLAEYGYGTSPASADTDNDGLTDSWELSNGYNPLNFADCMSDEDSDGFGTVYEVHHGTSWTNGAEYPAVTTNVLSDQKIQDVIAASPDYAIIRIEPGTYSGYKNRDIHFDGRPLMLTAEPGTVVLDVDSTIAFRSYSAGEDIRTVVDGLTVRNADQYAFYFQSAGLTIRNCVIENNGEGVTSGAGVRISGALAVIENCVFFQNNSTNGGAIYANNADLELRNCTLVSNRVTGAGGTIRFAGTGNTLTVLNSIIWEGGTNPVQLVSGTADITYSCIKNGYAGTGNISSDPLVLANGYHFNLNSPCIDAGTASGAPEKDIEGHGRTGAVDIGAWEYNAAYADSDEDGYTDAEETAAGSDPEDAESLPVSEVAVSGAVTYGGQQAGTIYVLAAAGAGDWNSSISVELPAPGAYSITNVPVLSNVWVKAWRDSNANGSNDAWEAHGESEFNPLYLTYPSSVIHITLNDPDTDADNLPDWWEYAHFSGLTLGGAGDPDGDGLVNSNEVVSLTDPNVADTDNDNWSDSEEVTLGSDPLSGTSIPVTQITVSGTVGYIGLQTGTVKVVAVTDTGSWSTVYSVSAAQPGMFSITNVPVLSNVWIKAWRDSDGNGSNGLYEASAVYSNNPLYLTRSVSNIVLTLTDLDSDSDSLPDWWENKYFTNLNQSATDDADGDTLNNLAEYGYHTSPASADTDNDGLTDSWELTNGYNPLLFADCMNDEDRDGFGTVYEVHHGTSWTNAAEVPAITTNVTSDQKIQDVIDASTNYAIINIQPGTYSGYKNRDIHFNGRPLMLTAEPGSVVLDVDGYIGVRSYSGGEDIRSVVDGLTIRNASQYAFYFQNSGLTIRNCVIENNGTGATSGAGLYLSGAPALVENCVFYRNVSMNGGAIYANNADLELRNCTLVSNSVTGASGTIRFAGTGNTLAVLNTIIWEEGTNPVHMVSGTADITHSCIKGGYTGTGNITNNPQVLTNGYHLNLNSPCINAGTASNAPLKDIEGHGRTGAVDIGAWEYNANYADSDGDGYTDAQESGISDPENAQSLPVNEVSVSGTVSYAGQQSGTVHVVAVTVSNDWNLAVSQGLSAPGAYSLTNVPVLSNVWIKAWRDSNEDGLCDSWEAQGVYGTNPLYLRVPVSGIDVVLEDPDTDADNLPDWWEYANFSGLSSGGADDPDGDGLVNSNEVLWLTNPNNPDSDEDGLGDGWMVTNSFSPLQISYEHLAGAWRLDETNGTTAVDSSEYGNGATVYGAAWNTGWLNGGLTFDGTNDSVAVANSAAYKPEQFTLMLRVRFGSLYGNTTVSAPDGTMTLLSQKETGSAPAIELRKTETHALEFEVSDGTSGTVVRSSDNFFVTGHWYQVTAVYDGTNAVLYADGTPVDSKAVVGPVSYAADEGLMLGGPASGLSGGYLAGTLDDVAIFSRAFSAQALAGLAFSVTDTDGDGLSNREEQQVGTNPHNADSDNDGLVDGEELRYGTDPKIADSDNDGLTDTAEVRTYYTNPNSSDSDSDGLSDYEEVITHGTDPNAADSDDDNLSDSTEIAAGTNPLNADSDGDGVKDGDEVTHGLNPLVAETDSDGDGLSNVNEVYFYGTSATNSDSDADGTNDLYTVNVLAGTNTIYRWTNNWVETGSALTAISNGLLRAEYAFNIAEPDVYLIGVQASNAWPNALSNAEFNVQMLVDGIPVEMLKINAAPGTNGWGLARTPFLTATTHVVRLAWMAEVETNELISIEAVALQRIDGQIEANGRQDWVNTLLASGVDSDGDGLSDLEELDQYGTVPLNADTDNDTLSDAEELNIFGLNPMLSDSDTNSSPDAVLLQTRNGSDTAERWGQWYDHSRDSTIATNEIKAIWDGVTAFYDFTVPAAGMYRVGIQVRNHWGDPKDNYSFRFLPSFDYQEAEPVEVYADTDRGNTVYFTTPWLTPGTHRIGFEWINDTWQTNRRIDMLLQRVRFYSVDGGTNDWMGDALTASGDSDGDGLSDYDEVHIYGTAPTVADTDGDGVNDGDEIAIGTNPNNRDSDSDGVDDYTELNIAYSNPTNADYGAVTTNLVINGSSFTTNLGTWAQDGNSIYARERNGFLEYNLNIATNGNYVLKVYGHQRNALTSQRTFDLRLYVNGMYTGKQLLDGPYGSNSASVLFFLPNLEAGSHTVRLDWENISPNTFLQIDKLELLSLEGDWLASRLDNIAGVDAVPADSLISPVFIEGMGWYQEMLRINSSYVPPEDTNYVPVIEQGIRQNWYSDVLLSPTNSTAVDVVEENGQRTWSNTVQWTEFNLPDVQTNLMTIRKGDALLLNSHPSGISTGAVQLEIIGVTNYTTTAEAPVPHVFDVAGVFTVEGVYSDGSTNLMAVKVVGGSFAGEPICVIRRERTWDCNNLPPEAVIEYDDRLTLSEALLPDGGRRFTLRTDQEEPLTVLARLGQSGPVLFKTTVQPVNGDNGAYWKTVQSFPDGSRMVMVNLHMGNVPDDLLIKLTIVVGGVTFEDGSTQKWLTAADFDGNGNCTYYLMQGAGLQTSTCHSTTVYQGDDPDTALKIESL